MRLVLFTGAIALALSACGHSGAGADQSNQTTQAGVYSGAGAITGIAGDQVTIKHGPIAGIGWPAMSMTFRAEGTSAAGFKPGDKVRFAFKKDGQGYTLTSLTHG